MALSVRAGTAHQAVDGRGAQLAPVPLLSFSLSLFASPDICFYSARARAAHAHLRGWLHSGLAGRRGPIFAIVRAYDPYLVGRSLDPTRMRAVVCTARQWSVRVRGAGRHGVASTWYVVPVVPRLCVPSPQRAQLHAVAGPHGGPRLGGVGWVTGWWVCTPPSLHVTWARPPRTAGHRSVLSSRIERT